MKRLFCTVCKSEGKPVTKTKGSLLVEIGLWLFFIFPGIIYSLWRISGREKVCRFCGSTNLIPLDSPYAKEISKKQYQFKLMELITKNG